MPSRTTKKSETIEIRLSHEAKTAFMDHCAVSACPRGG